MTRALFKKQMMEVFSWLFQNKKSGKNRSKAGIFGYAVLYLFIFAMLGFLFYAVADMLCAPLVSAGLGWLYMALMGLIAVFLGVFGSVFNTYASLYMAKDNDLLLSMPVPTGRILMIRLSGVFAMGLMYELIVMIPTLIVWFMTARPGAAGVIFSLLIPLVLVFPFFMGAIGVFLAEPVSNVIGGSLCFVTMLLTILPELKRMEQ